MPGAATDLAASEIAHARGWPFLPVCLGEVGVQVAVLALRRCAALDHDVGARDEGIVDLAGVVAVRADRGDDRVRLHERAVEERRRGRGGEHQNVCLSDRRIDVFAVRDLDALLGEIAAQRLDALGPAADDLEGSGRKRGASRENAAATLRADAEHEHPGRLGQLIAGGREGRQLAHRADRNGGRANRGEARTLHDRDRRERV